MLYKYINQDYLTDSSEIHLNPTRSKKTRIRHSPYLVHNQLRTDAERPSTSVGFELEIPRSPGHDMLPSNEGQSNADSADNLSLPASEPSSPRSSFPASPVAGISTIVQSPTPTHTGQLPNWHVSVDVSIERTHVLPSGRAIRSRQAKFSGTYRDHLELDDDSTPEASPAPPRPRLPAHKPKVVFPCDICKSARARTYEFKRNHDFKRHMETVHRAHDHRYKCQACPKGFDRIDTFQRHFTQALHQPCIAYYEAHDLEVPKPQRSKGRSATYVLSSS